jgi:hypothetical protein
MRRLRSRAGFTVEEIMTALVIIAIGNCFIIYQSRKAREIARTTACASNVRQLALAMRMYASDNDGFMPPAAHAVAGLNEYLKSSQIYQCPSDPTPVEVAAPGLGTFKLSYLLNTQVRLDDLPGTILVGDSQPDRHLGRRWNGARLDGAGHLWPADQWETQWGPVVKDEDRTHP